MAATAGLTVPINDTTFELSVFWPSDAESQINELRFSDSISLSFKTRLTLVTFFAATLLKVDFKHGTRDRKHDYFTSRNETLRQMYPQFFCIKDENSL